MHRRFPFLGSLEYGRNGKNRKRRSIVALQVSPRGVAHIGQFWRVDLANRVGEVLHEIGLLK
jgi:hypothetical protein